MNKIALFTGTRAEYGLMRTLILNLIADSQFDFNLLVSALLSSFQTVHRESMLTWDLILKESSSNSK